MGCKKTQKLYKKPRKDFLEAQTWGHTINGMLSLQLEACLSVTKRPKFFLIFVFNLM